MSDAPFAAEVDRFNELLAKVVAEPDTPRSPPLLASRRAGWDLHRDTYDGTHPNTSGEHRLAAASADADTPGVGPGRPVHR